MSRPSVRHLREGSGLGFAALVVASTMWLLVSSAPAFGGSPDAGWRAGDPATSPVIVSAATSLAAAVHARAILSRLGISSRTATSSRATDLVSHLTLDTTMATDATGRRVATVIVDADSGRLRTVVNYAADGLAPQAVPSVEQVTLDARAYLATAGVPLQASRPDVAWDEGMEAWQVMWTRTIASVSAPADFVSAWISPGGSVKALSDIESPNASVPELQIPATQAQAIVRTFLGRSPTAATWTVSIGAATMEWRAPNNFADPALPDAPDLQLRLVFAVPYTITVASTQHGQGVLWVAADDGTIVGGSDVS